MFNSDTKKINIYLPDLYKNGNLNMYFVTIQKTVPDAFYPNIQIKGSYGTFPYSIWSNEREYKYISKKQLQQVLNIYKKNKLSLILCFNNSEISIKDINDTYSNLILKLAYSDKNSVIVNSEILYNYIKAEYPAYNLIKEDTLKESQNYDALFIKNIKTENMQKFPDFGNSNIYCLLNPICQTSCSFLYIHNKYINNEQMDFSKISKYFICPLRKDLSFYSLTNNKEFISIEEIEEYYNKGIKNFLIGNQDISKYTDTNYSFLDIIESYIYYLIKPDKQNYIRNKVLKICRKEKK